MRGFIDSLLIDEEISGVAASPALNELLDIDEKEEKSVGEKKERFYSVVQILLYLSVQFRRDICLEVAFLTSRVREPDNGDWKKLRRVLQYLNGTVQEIYVLPLIVKMMIYQFW